MKVAVEGCAHGDLEKIYESIQYLEECENIKVDLLICCGDFQATRNVHDLDSMAVPKKYREMCSFYKYYGGEKTAPILTIFIGGNHEASNHLQELPYGGWVAPNIYYLGYAGVINIAGLRLAGLSGIYKPYDFTMGRYERPPYSEQSKRTVYHIRNIDVFRLKQLKKPIDIFITHDWPRGVHKFGNVDQLLRFKPHFREDIENNKLGSAPAEELLYLIKPRYWFSAHLHCKFAAIIPHNVEKTSVTKFLALDKCLPKRKFLQIIDIEHDSSKPIQLEYDAEWLAILHFTNHLNYYKKDGHILPNKDFAESGIRYDFTPSDVELEFVQAKMMNDFKVPQNFVQTVSAYIPGQPSGPIYFPTPNPQTQAFCQRIGISDMFEEVLKLESGDSQSRRSQGSPATPQFNSFVDSDLGNLSSTSSEEQELEDSQEMANRSSSSLDSDVSPMRGALSLPPPKNSQSSDDTTYKDSQSPLSQEPVHTPKRSEPSENFPFIVDTTPLTHKKFKRRNQNIYQIQEDDES